MGTMSPQELLKFWTLEKLSEEMAIGHILQNLVQIQATTASNSRTLHQLCREVDGLVVHSGIKPRSENKSLKED